MIHIDLIASGTGTGSANENENANVSATPHVNLTNSIWDGILLEEH